MSFSTRILGRRQRPALRHGLAALVVATTALAACGQKGALFLPPEPTATTTPAPQALPTASRPAASATR